MAENYEAGTLSLSVLGISDSAVTSIDRTVKSLDALYSAVRKINNTDFVSSAKSMSMFFTDISKATKKIDTSALATLASSANSLSSISKLSRLEKLDYGKVATGFNSLTTSITPFLEKVQTAETSLNSLYGILQNTSGKKYQNLLGGGADVGGKGNALSSLLKIGKGASIVYTFRRIGNLYSNLIQAGSDYNETLNLWQVAMRDNLDLAEQFVSKMNRAYGIGTKTLMNAQAIFKNMVGSLGQISDDVAYQISEALVQMSADFSSLYNVTLESAFNKMQAMLSRQVRPIRSVSGLDITENTLFEFYQELGGTKRMRQLSNTEKQLLSILAVYRQMGRAGALGDMTKTLNEFANQSRMMTGYWGELKTWTGLILKDFIDQTQVLVYINALLITTTEIIKAIAKSRGLGKENYIDGLFETTEATNEAVDELQGKLLDFDKFRALSGTDENVLGIDQKLLEAIAGYSSQIDKAQNKAQELAYTWLSFFGFTKLANGELSITTENLEDIKTVLYLILGIIGSLVAIGIYNGISKIVLGLKAVLSASTMLQNSIVGLAYGFTAFYALTEAFDNMYPSVRKVLAPLAIALGLITAIWGAAKGGLAGAAFAGVGVGAILAGIKATASDFSSSSVSVPDTNVVSGASAYISNNQTPIVATNDNRNLTQQMKTAMYQAMVEYNSSHRDTKQPIVVYLDGEKVYENTTSHAKAHGETWTNVR